MVSGKAGVGKTTFSNMLVDSLATGGKFARVLPIAKGVKDCATQFFGWDGKKDERGRKLLQNVGAIGRSYNPDNWIDLLVGSLPSWMDSNDIVICDDWRFENESLYLEKYGYKVFRIRVSAPSREILKGTPEYEDVSETSLPDEMNPFYYDAFIDNEISLEELVFVASAIADEVIVNFLPEES